MLIGILGYLAIGLVIAGASCDTTYDLALFVVLIGTVMLLWPIFVLLAIGKALANV